MDKKVKIILAVVAILAIIGIVVGIVIVTGNKNKDGNTNNSSENGSASVPTVAIEDVTISSGEIINNDGENVGESLVESHKVSNQWQSGSSYFKQYDFVVENVSDKVQTDWKVVLNVPEGTKISSSWNCECEIQGTQLIIKPASHSLTIQPSSKVENIGIILEAPQEEVITGSGNVDSSQVANQNETEKQTEKQTQGQTVKPADPIPVVSGTPFSRHGKLSVSGSNIVDKNGNVFRLCGISTHGIQWGEMKPYVNKDTFQYLRDDWGANMIRLAMYAREGGYVGGNKSELKELIDKGVKAATELGMYVIIDWHVLNFNPNETKSDAIEFFDEIVQKYSSYDNVIYEICNEPTGSPFVSQIKPYATAVVNTIRKYDSDAIIIVGTNTWSQDIGEVVGNKLTDKNTMYAVHFYAATHTEWLRNNVENAIKAGVPVFISECSICDASGNGAINYDEADKWFALLEKYNVSYAIWNLSNKAETSSLISSGCSKLSGFSDNELSATGRWFKSRITKDAKGK